jgi:outer membrane protein
MLRRTVIALVMAFFCSAVILPSQAQAAGKIGVANPIRLSTQSDPGKEAEKQLSSMFGKEREQLEKQGADLNKQAEELKKQAAALSEKARNERAQKIQKQAQELDTKGTAYTQRLSRVQQAINAQINEVLRTACENYAKKNGYDMILDATVVMFYLQANDVTSGLIEEVNKVWKSKGGKFNLSSVK